MTNYLKSVHILKINRAKTYLKHVINHDRTDKL